MSLSKLRKIHIIIIGSVLCVIAVVAMYFLVIKPKQVAFKAAEDRFNAAKDLGNEMARNNALADQSKAIVEVAMKQREMQVVMDKKMPDLSFDRRDIGMLQLWKEYITNLGPLLNHYANDKGVDAVDAQFKIPTPPLNPNDALFDSDMITVPLGDVQVTGSSFKALMNNITRWNNCSRLVMVGPPAISGNSPYLMGKYSLTCYIFPATKGGPKIELAGQGGGTNQ